MSKAYRIHIGEDCDKSEPSMFITIFRHEISTEVKNIITTILRRDCNIRWVVHHEMFYEEILPLTEAIGQSIEIIPMTLKQIGVKTNNLESRYYWESFNDHNH